MSLSPLPEQFALRFGRAPAAMARAPGRVNLIGEHVDYNDGWVLPIAVQMAARAAAAPRDDDRIRVASLQFSETEASVADPEPPAWARGVLGVATLLRRRGARLPGFDLLLDSDVPVAAGLSSSAAVEVAAVLALSAIAGEALVAAEVVDLCMQAEAEFVGVPCGVLDPTASLMGKSDAALLLDCRDRSATHVPLALGDCALAVIHSGVPRALAGSEYARRRSECGQAVAHLRRLNRSVNSLRDVSVETVRAQALQMPPLAAARALHVTTEIRRTLAAAEALRHRDLATFGRLMNESHRSLRDDYEVSHPFVDRVVDSVGGMPGVLGIRITGAGFGGCMIALLRRSALADVAARVAALDPPPGGEQPFLLEVRPSAGAALEKV